MTVIDCEQEIWARMVLKDQLEDVNPIKCTRIYHRRLRHHREMFRNGAGPQGIMVDEAQTCVEVKTDAAVGAETMAVAARDIARVRIWIIEARRGQGVEGPRVLSVYIEETLGCRSVAILHGEAFL